MSETRERRDAGADNPGGPGGARGGGRPGLTHSTSMRSGATGRILEAKDDESHATLCSLAMAWRRASFSSLWGTRTANRSNTCVVSGAGRRAARA